MQPVLETVSDSVGTLTDGVTGVIAPIEATVQPVLETVNDSVGTLTGDVTGTIAPVDATVQPVLETVSDVAGVTGTVQPVLETVADNVNTLANDVPPAAASAGTAVDGVDPVLAPAPGSDADTGNQAATETNNAIAPHVGSAGLVSGVVAPVLPDLPDLLNGLQAAGPDTAGTSTDHTIATVVPGAVTLYASPPAITDAESQPITLSQTAASDTAGAHTSDSSASAIDGSASTTSDLAPIDATTDALANVVSGVDTTEPSLESAPLNDPTRDMSHPTDTTLASDTLPSAAPVVDTTAP